MSELDDQIQNRRRKRALLAERGVPAYPHRFRLDLEPAGVHARYGELDAAALEAEPVRLKVPGRIRALRSHGKSTFLDLHDGRAKLQVYLRHDKVDDATRELLEQLDLGDLAGATGTLMRTRTGELTLAAESVVLLAKALRPLPEKWHGLSDVETRYRQRYLDLVVNEDTRRVFETRAAIVRGIRDFFDRRDFLEVETPMMQAIAGGAAARPFVTHHNALDIDLYLRIAPELYLKRLVVGGLHRVYEINRNFRNEGISTRHNPEFTMLEFYWAYHDYQDLMNLTEELLVGLATAIRGEPSVVWKGERLDLSPPWTRLSVKEAVTRFGGIPAERLDHVTDLAAEHTARGLSFPPAVHDPKHPILHAGSAAAWQASGGAPLAPEVEESWAAHLLMSLFEETAEAQLQAPTFVTDFPTVVSPLSKQRPDDPRFTERFELYLAGMEMANGFTELNDPDDQAERFRQQVEARTQGDDEAMLFDHDYVRALEHGMPPTAGEGIGIDRLTMVFADQQSIRDVILFPLLRPQPLGA